MRYERFLKVLLSLQKEDRTIKTLYDNGVDLINFVDPYHKIIHELIEEIYGENGLKWFSWYCWENDFGQKGLEVLDSDRNPIVYSHELFWKDLEMDRYKNSKSQEE